ncbi:type I-E CRISPR-associated protein Cas6/Cse3/CasE [Dubosiella newyorkensis]|uniref:type I-E CRISPR-associated protein Cas6/Cse3/CasE n=1 Tax=Dubosiella newyorkensis TaxID=1862672 RepID=UPI00259C6D69|nr:type I-E CRISPR-associated protein Cas6/Cse3/CasE [Dubosiella newyorkensis]
MILTRILLDVKNPHTILALGNPNLFHGALEKSVRGTETPLWRVDTLNGNYYLMVLSKEKLDAEVLTSQFSESKECVQSVDYNCLLTRLEPGSIWNFRLVANPTVSIKTRPHSRERGKVVACIHEEQQLDWLKKKAEKNGFMFQENQVRIVGERWIRFKKHKDMPLKKGVCFFSVTFEGILEVTNVKKFIYALENGIGKEKAYGMGLLTVVKI